MIKKPILPTRLSDEAEKFLLGNADYIKAETNTAVFTKDQKFKMSAAYTEITGKVPSKSCGGLCAQVLKVCRNWLKWFENTQVDTVEEAVAPVNLEDKTKAELLDMYPNALNKKMTKAVMIETIQGA